jgi:uncharacterized protein
MKKIFIGREEEKNILLRAYNHREARFVAIFGRRRVGKTYLIRQVFEEKITFYMTGLSNVNSKQQILNFHTAMQRQGGNFPTVPENWFFAFQHLIDFLEASPHAKKVVFLDELPWLANKKFRTFLEQLGIGKNGCFAGRLRVVCLLDGQRIDKK